MPNGISCAYFAGKNLIYGKKEHNIFKEGIAGAQTVRTIDSAAASGVINVPAKNTISKVAGIAKKILYPLIVMSGVYNTIQSDDKIKTGVEQASGIASMYTFEKVAETGLNSIENKVKNTNIVKNNKKLACILYVLKGIAFVSASLTGYKAGNDVAGNAVDFIRNALNKNKQNYLNPVDITEKSNQEAADNDLKKEAKENNYKISEQLPVMTD